MKSHIILAKRNLTRRKSRTLLTMIGVILAVGFTVGLLSISEGFMRSFDKMFGAGGPEVYVMPKGGGNMPLHMHCGGPGIDEGVADLVAAAPGVKVAEPAVSLMATSSSQKSKGTMMRGMPALVFGVPPSTFAVMHPDSKIETGRFMRDGDAYTIVAGEKFAENQGVVVGDNLDIGEHTVKVVGILKPGGMIDDYVGYIPLKSAQEIREKPGKVCQIFVKIDNIKDADKVKENIKAMLHGKYDVATVAEALDKARQMMAMTQAVHFGISCFSLMIGVLFVATTMIMSVSERMREFATLRVIGASKSFIRKLIVTESLILSCMGGMFGFVLGVILSKIINIIINRTVGETFIHTYISLKLFLIGLAISLLIGTFAGLLPARMIMKKELAESLRYE